MLRYAAETFYMDIHIHSMKGEVTGEDTADCTEPPAHLQTGATRR